MDSDQRVLNVIDPFISAVEVQQNWRATCVCGREFPTPSGYTSHITICKRYRQRLEQEQSDSRVAWEQRKQGRVKGAAAIRMSMGDLDFDAPSQALRASVALRRPDEVRHPLVRYNRAS